MVGWMRLFSWSCSLLDHSLEFSDPTVHLQFGWEMCLLDRQFSHLGSPNRRGLSLNPGSIGCKLPDQNCAPSEEFPDSLSQMALPLPLTLVWLPQGIVPVPWGPQPHSSSSKKNSYLQRKTLGHMWTLLALKHSTKFGNGDPGQVPFLAPWKPLTPVEL